MNKYLKLAQELLAPVQHLAETDKRFADYVQAVASKLEAFENEIRQTAKGSGDSSPPPAQL